MVRMIYEIVAALSRPLKSGSLLFSVLVLSVPLVVAEGRGHAVDPHPLRPADTSSPRDTLRTFHTSIEEALRAFQAGAPSEQITRAGQRARETLDFSQLPERGRRAKEVKTALFLKEILDRIELPPDQEIPGDEEVADKEKPLAHWRIPNTRITISQVKEGPRAGEFLFDARTVDRLEEYYESARHLPYKPGALVGLYEAYAHRPGRMVPQSWAAALPAWSMTVVFGQALWQWLGFAIVAWCIK